MSIPTDHNVITAAEVISIIFFMLPKSPRNSIAMQYNRYVMYDLITCMQAQLRAYMQCHEMDSAITLVNCTQCHAKRSYYH